MTEKHQCAGTVFPSGGWRGYQCSANGKMEHEGRHFCARHHPPTVQAKKAEKQAEWGARAERIRAERNAIAAVAAEQKRRAECFPDLLQELQDILEWAVHERAPLRDQEISSIRAAIRKATGENHA